MNTTHTWGPRLLTGSVLIVGLTSFVPHPLARAAFVATLNDAGADMILTGTGTFDTTDLTLMSTPSTKSAISATVPLVVGGPTIDTAGEVYSGVTSPGFYGTSGFASATGGGGDLAGVSSTVLLVPAGHNPTDVLSFSNTFSGLTIASMDLTPGTYVWTWGTTNPDSFTLHIGIPEPSTSTCIALTFGLVPLLRFRAQRQKLG